MAMEIQVLAWDRHKNMVELNWFIGSQFFLLDNCMLKRVNTLCSTKD